MTTGDDIQVIEFYMSDNIQVLEFYIDGGTNGLNGQSAKSIYFSVRQTYPFDEWVYQRQANTTWKTNNEAEYAALMNGLTFISDRVKDKSYIIFRTDSMLLVNQMNDRWKVKTKTLQPLHAFCKNIINDLTSRNHTVSIIWTPRKSIVEQLGH